MNIENLRLRKEIEQLEKIKYETPMITKVEFDTQSTTVLGDCSGWKDSAVALL